MEHTILCTLPSLTRVLYFFCRYISSHSKRSLHVFTTRSGVSSVDGRLFRRDDVLERYKKIPRAYLNNFHSRGETTFLLVVVELQYSDSNHLRVQETMGEQVKVFLQEQESEKDITHVFNKCHSSIQKKRSRPFPSHS